MQQSCVIFGETRSPSPTPGKFSEPESESPTPGFSIALTKIMQNLIKLSSLRRANRKDNYTQVVISKISP